MPAQIMEPGDLYTLPVGAVIRRTGQLNGIEAAIKTGDGDWLITGQAAEHDAEAIAEEWLGAEVLTPARIAVQAARMADAMSASLHAITEEGGAR